MRELPPTCNPDAVFCVKRACAELEISRKTLRKYRSLGLITPMNPENKRRPKYSGQSLIDCWNLIVKL